MHTKHRFLVFTGEVTALAIRSLWDADIWGTFSGLFLFLFPLKNGCNFPPDFHMLSRFGVCLRYCDSSAVDTEVGSVLPKNIEVFVLAGS